MKNSACVKTIWFVLLLATTAILSGCNVSQLLPVGASPVATYPRLATSTPTPTSTITNTPAPPTATVAAFNSVATGTPVPTPSATATATRAFSNQGDTLPTATSTPTDTPVPGLACTVNTGELNVREGPGTNYRVVDTLLQGTSVSATKCVPGGDWLLVETDTQQVGWVNATYVACQGNLDKLPQAAGVSASSAPTVAPVVPSPTNTPQATETAQLDVPVNQWRGEYFDNPSLAGEPVLVRVDPELDFNWILDSPGPGIPNDNFSARWTGVFNLAAGDYRFYARSDDGVRVYVDGRPIIDFWQTNIPVDHYGNYTDLSAGLHTITVEYFESGGYAYINVWADEGNFTDDNWYGEYYTNRNLEGAPQFTRQDEEIDFDWGSGSPDEEIFGRDDFSIRWKRTVYLEFGDYEFFADVEDNDSVKVTIDGWSVIDEVADDDTTLKGYFDNLGGDNVSIIVEFKELGNKAKIDFWWNRK